MRSEKEVHRHWPVPQQPEQDELVGIEQDAVARIVSEPVLQGWSWARRTKRKKGKATSVRFVSAETKGILDD
jgi:hypothetical protein